MFQTSLYKHDFEHVLGLIRLRQM